MLALTLFGAGILTIFLPCILPLVPIVVGASIGDRNPWRPFMIVLGMVVSFVAFSFLLLVLLRQFVWVGDYLRIATHYVLFLFGIGFFTGKRLIHILAALVGSLFFVGNGWIAIGVAASLGIGATFAANRVASFLQLLGADVQSKTRTRFGNTAISAFIIGSTLGLVWMPCAGPALSFAYALVREQPGLKAAVLLFVYAAGTALPLLLIGYGGQKLTYSVRYFSRFSGHIKQVSGILLIVSALMLRLGGFQAVQSYLIERGLGTLGTDIEQRLFGEAF